ncbi:MAG: MFS transporter [Flavobacteriaceae bacterium]|jgi:fucose permease|nr:MFS transporter [Flavobacteriaceae bacterium]MDP4675180.1 MFS transporter [Flavobacteriaceae bacterium]MDP4754870.1 MFS transporter [Flavobacteriaceae bacterium]MDP4795002.1 MFS transporter [Flavobacteriaceae bacterium]MDP4971053.1 MFS transporter [Flavobacteriaceae bacterium]
MKSLGLILRHRRYFAPAWAFMSLNLVYGTWAIYIPTIKAQLEIDKSALGIAIFFMAMGSFLILPIAPRINDYLGCGKATTYGILALGVLGILPFIAPTYPFLLGGLFLLGAAQGFLDISMNATVAEIERRDQVTLMTAMHGFFSLGGVLAGLGTFAIAWFTHAYEHMGVILVLMVLVNIFFFSAYKDITSPAKKESGFSAKHLKPLLLLGVISFVVMGSEGAIVDWSGLYLQEIVQLEDQWIGAGFLGFSIAMTTGRFFGDGISQRIGSEKILALGAAVAILGYTGVLQDQMIWSISGFTAIGLGLSVVIPELFRMAGRQKTISPSKAMAIVAGFGYSGFLTGPVILGFIAEGYGLHTSYYSLLGAIIAVLITALFLILNPKK